jgi:hypothetical protein
MDHTDRDVKIVIEHFEFTAMSSQDLPLGDFITNAVAKYKRTPAASWADSHNAKFNIVSHTDVNNDSIHHYYVMAIGEKLATEYLLRFGN